MRTCALIPPVVVIITSAIWLTSQRHALSTTKSKTATLSNPRTVTSTDATASRGFNSTGKKLGSRQINWRRTGEIGAQDYKGIFAQQEWLRFQKHVGAMTPAELITSLDEVDALDVDGRSRDALWRKLIMELGNKDPEAALNRLTDKVASRNFGSNTAILSQWAVKDPAGAAAWLDGKIAGGTFNGTSPDGKNNLHLRYEAALFGTLIKLDPDAAADRLSAIPERQRADMLSDFFMSHRTPLADAELKTYIELVRNLVPERQQSHLIVNPVLKLANQAGFDQIDKFLDDIGASPAERQQSVELTARTKGYSLIFDNRLNVQELDELRSWMATQAPEKVESATVGILQNAAINGDSGFDRAAELALHYQQTTGSDDILARFLSNSFAPSQNERARSLAERITDSGQRAKVLQNLNQ